MTLANAFNLYRAALSLTLLLIFAATLNAQQAVSIGQPREQAVAALEKGDYSNAIKLLRDALKQNENDANAWHYLGRSYFAAKMGSEAKQAFERAVAIGSPNASAEAKAAYIDFHTLNLREALSHALKGSMNRPPDRDAALAMTATYTRAQLIEATISYRSANESLRKNPNFADAYFQRAQSALASTVKDYQLMPTLSRYKNPKPKDANETDEESEAERTASRLATAQVYKQALADFENYLRLSPKGDEADFARSQVGALQFYIPLSEFDKSNVKQANAPEIATTSEVTKKVVIKDLREPPYTSQARRKGVSGIVRMRVVMAADGEVKHPLVLLYLPYGLAKQSLAAARKIEFEPAQKDDRLISQYNLLVFHFTLY